MLICGGAAAANTIGVDMPGWVAAVGCTGAC